MVATFQHEAKIVFRSQGGTFAAQDTDRLGMRSSVPLVAFGARWVDCDNDSLIDALAVDSDGAPLLLRNVTPRAASWLQVELQGRRNNRDG